MTPVSIVAPACRNCGQTLPSPPPPFCPQCGQQTDVRPPSVGEFVHQFAGTYLSVEGELWRTLKLLLIRPGALTAAYLAGQRKHYVLPLRLYLSISLLVLLAANLRLSHLLDEAPSFEIDVQTSEIVLFDFGLARAGIDRGRFYCDNLPAATCQRLERRLNRDPSTLWEQGAAAGQRTVGNLGAAMFVLVPVFALLLKAAFATRGLRYAEHLVFALHVHAFWFLAIALPVAGVPWAGEAAALAMPVYLMLAARRVYAGRWSDLLLRLLPVVVLYAVLLVVGISALALWAMLF